MIHTGRLYAVELGYYENQLALDEFTIHPPCEEGLREQGLEKKIILDQPIRKKGWAPSRFQDGTHLCFGMRLAIGVLIRANVPTVQLPLEFGSKFKYIRTNCTQWKVEIAVRLR